MDNLTVSDIKMQKAAIRGELLQFEKAISEIPGAMFNDCFPLEHTFANGVYVRKIKVPKGVILATKIHKVEHPFFLMQGDVSILTEDGSRRIKAPYNGITPAGTKRIIYIHEDTVWITVHVTKERDLDKIEADIIAPDFQSINLEVIEIENKKIQEFINKLQNKEKIECLGY